MKGGLAWAEMLCHTSVVLLYVACRWVGGQCCVLSLLLLREPVRYNNNAGADLDWTDHSSNSSVDSASNAYDVRSHNQPNLDQRGGVVSRLSVEGSSTGSQALEISSLTTQRASGIHCRLRLHLDGTVAHSDTRPPDSKWSSDCLMTDCAPLLFRAAQTDVKVHQEVKDMTRIERIGTPSAQRHNCSHNSTLLYYLSRTRCVGPISPYMSASASRRGLYIYRCSQPHSRSRS